jgi:hypothetical protein
MRGVILGVVAVAGVAGAGVGFLQASNARRAEANVRGRAAALEGDVAHLRRDLETSRAETAAAAADLAGLRKDLAKAKADLDLAKQSMIQLDAAAREADEARYAAGERARVAAEARARAEASAAAKAREADAARAGLEDARARAAVAEAERDAAPQAAKVSSGKAVAACAAIAQAIDYGGKELTDPLKIESSYLEWLTGEGGWSSRDIADFTPWVQGAWSAVAAGRRVAERDMSPGGSDTRDKGKRMERALADVKKAFLDNKPDEALKTFRFWRPERD